MGFNKSFWRRLKEKNERAFALFFDFYYPRLVAYVLKFTSKNREAEDLSQDAMVSFWLNVQKLKPSRKFMESYLIRILKNKMIDYYRKYNKIGFSDNDVGVLDVIFHQHYALEEEELHNKIISILNSLPEKTKNIFYQSRNEELTYKEIAIKRNISIKTVELHISKALKALRTNLKDYMS